MLRPARPDPDVMVAVADDVELAIWHDGPEPSADATPFLLVHGLASNAHLWDGVAAELAAAGHAVASVDLRGHGRSSKPDGEDAYALEVVSDDVIALVRALALPAPAVLVGQSYGAPVVLAAALGLGDAVAAVGCVDGGHIDLRSRFPDWERCERLLAPPRSAGRAAVDVERYLREAHPNWPAQGVAGSFACFEVRDDGTVAPWLTYERHLQVLRGLWAADTAALRRATTHHVLLLSADEGSSTATKHEDVARAAEQLRDVEVLWMDGDHDLHAQHPAAVAAALLRLATRP